MITDGSVANDVIYRVLENGDADADFTVGAPLLTSMFTKQEIIDSMNRIQQQFLLETGMTVTRTTIPAVVGQAKYDTPTGNIRPRRVTWNGAATIRTLTQVDTWELDHGMTEWGTDNGTPIAWHETTLPQQQLAIAPTPADVGEIGLLYVALASMLDGTGIALSIPDDWTPYILWGTLSELLSSDGPTYDPVRASYCNQRYQEGIELARLVMGG